MKKGQKFLKDNRGAALVSIMIAVAFIAILASALLYMSYSNFKMKVVNYESKVNFYETEADLTTITTSIRNEIANATAPMDALKTAVGCYEIAPNTYQYGYNPKALAKLLDSSITIADGEVAQAGTVNYSNGTKTVVNQKAASSNNFLVYSKDGADHTLVDDTLGANEKKIVLKDVVVEHTENENGYVNTLQTDIVFRVKEESSKASPGGIGEFSVLMDSPIGSGDGSPTRVTFYGNALIGPGTYAYGGDGKVDPSAVDALTLKEYANFTQKGDYMIVFGNVRLTGQSVLNISGGTLAVYGDIILEDSAALLCTGNVYLMEGCSIVTSATTANNVFPKELLTGTGVETIKPESYKSVTEALGVDDANNSDNDDGILRQILTDDGYKVLSGISETNDSAVTNVYGMDYRIRTSSETSMNGGNVSTRLVFVNNANAEFQDGANLNSTFIAFTPIDFKNAKNNILTQMGSAVFNYLIDADNIGEVSKLKVKSTETSSNLVEVDVSTYFEADCNKIVNTLINSSTNDSGGKPTVITAVGYENWTKE